ncbi:MAG TPA: O-antigen ligase family protein, partial [Gaiellaceae bacterium]|nr:O-antigen ligase family protein [Gaiellaceae bacterium]
AMLASFLVRSAGVRLAGSVPLLAWGAGALCACALFFSGGVGSAPLVWIGAIALALAAAGCAAVFLGLAPAPRASAAGAVFLGALVALAAWEGISMLWSVSPDASWVYANRTVVYVAFALVGFLVAPPLRRPAATLAGGAALLLGAVIAWALLAKCVASLYPDYERLARLRSPVQYWNELALLADVAVAVGLWRATSRRAAGMLLVYGATLTVLLTYSRFGIALACVIAVAWALLDRSRVQTIATIVVGGGAGAAAFGVALALPGISHDHVSHASRAHDGWIFGLVVLAGAGAVALAAPAVTRLRLLAPPLQRRIERAAGLAALVLAVAAVAVGAAEAHRIWNDFANPVGAQVSNGAGHLASASSSNRWRWWQEAWHAFTRHPGGGTGAATFQFTDELLRTSNVGLADEPHNTPLQFLSENGIVALLIYVSALVALGVCVVRRRARASADERVAITALGLALAAFAAHMLVDKDWNYVATCGPLLLVAGVLVGALGERSAKRRILPSLAAVVLALAAAYSLASPWLAQNELSSAATVAAAKRAHAYDPLSTDALFEWAALEDVDGHTGRAEQLYRQEVSLEPNNSSTWYDLGQFYTYHSEWRRAYIALSNAWRLDKFGPAGTPCGVLDQARHHALGVWPPTCPGGRPASRP